MTNRPSTDFASPRPATIAAFGALAGAIVATRPARRSARLDILDVLSTS